jgi:NCS1 family nucleobase:cation symporter-1
MLVIMIAQITTNMAANVVAPATGFSNLSPRRISFLTGSLMTATLGVAMMPWRVMQSAGDYIFTWLIGYSSLMGALAGILICDYWVLRRRRLDLRALFDPDGIYSYGGGFNVRAVLALGLAVAPVVPGFVRAATTPGGIVAEPGFFDTLYTYAWFVTFGTSFGLYALLMRGRVQSFGDQAQRQPR